MEKLKTAFQSRKLWATLAGVTFAIIGILNDWDSEKILVVSGMFMSYVLGQGIADSVSTKPSQPSESSKSSDEVQ